MKVKKIALLANTENHDVKKIVNEMNEFFTQMGITVYPVKLQSSVKDLKIKPVDVDLAVSLGGDGTVLSCAGIFRETKVPLFAVNMGTFGYMTQISVNNYKEVFKDYLEDKCFCVERMRLNIRVERNNKTVFKSSALNEFTVSSATRAKMVKLSLSINDVLAANLRGDGIIIATPTGSTAYNLSSGGPILDANLTSIIINPICPFTMGVRPLVISSDAKTVITIPEQNVKVILSSDGHEIFNLKNDDVVIIEKSNNSTLFVENKKSNFIEVLRNKLGWAGGFNA